MKVDEHGHDVAKLYGSIGGPFYAVHFNGYPYAAFSGPNQALAYWRGLDAEAKGYFHIENSDGQRVTFEEKRRGHAYAILDKL